MKIALTTIIVLLLSLNSLSFERSKTSATNAQKTTREVKIYLVAVGDNGKMGEKIGCEDSLVPVNRTIAANKAILKTTLDELLSIPEDYNDQLRNSWHGENLKVKSVSINKGVATVHISGKGPFVGGICDEPRIISQIEETAKQFSTVKEVKVFVNDRPLVEVLH